MLSLDREAVICDLAEEYHIYDMRSLPARQVATLAVGLRDDSRIKRKIRGSKYSRQELLLAQIHDRLAGLLWLWGGYGDTEQPPSLVEVMINGIPEDEEGDFREYRSAEEFDAAWIT